MLLVPLGAQQPEEPSAGEIAALRGMEAAALADATWANACAALPRLQRDVSEHGVAAASPA